MRLDLSFRSRGGGFERNGAHHCNRVGRRCRIMETSGVLTICHAREIGGLRSRHNWPSKRCLAAGKLKG